MFGQLSLIGRNKARKPVTAPDILWNSSDSYGISVSSGQKLAQVTQDQTYQKIRAQDGYSSGRIYAEISGTIDNGYSGAWGLGFVRSSISLNRPQYAIGAQDTQSVLLTSVGAYYELAEPKQVANFPPFTTGDTMGVVLDFDAKKAYFLKNNILVLTVNIDLTGGPILYPVFQSYDRRENARLTNKYTPNV